MASATFNLPTGLDNALKSEAKKKLTSKSTLIRQVLANYVESLQPEKPKGARK